jgi:small subunit ribosomal protein S21
VINIQRLGINKHFYPAEHSGVCVVRRSDESDEDLIRRFRKKYSKSGLSREVRQKMYFEKPSDRKRRKKAQSIRLKLKEEEKQEEMRERARIRRFKLNKKRTKREIKND